MDGMVQGLVFENGRADYRNRGLRTPKYLLEEKHGWPGLPDRDPVPAGLDRPWTLDGLPLAGGGRRPGKRRQRIEARAA